MKVHTVQIQVIVSMEDGSHTLPLVFGFVPFLKPNLISSMTGAERLNVIGYLERALTALKEAQP